MYITSHTLNTIAWSSLAFSVARASYVIDNLSFGQHEGQAVSPNLRAIPHFFINGNDYEPEIFSDRIMLTPPWPGNRRGAIWSEDPLRHAGDWLAELSFRASGPERGGGNLQLWYTKESQKGQTPNSLYTAPKFDGLVLLIDQYEGRGGSVRGYLNDGSIDIKAHNDPDTLAFGQCNYGYRNLGRLSTIKLQHAHGELEVTVDGYPCFKTDKVKLPEGYYFGISASSAENPDSFEVHRFVVSTINAYTREEPNRQQNQEPMGGMRDPPHQQQHHQQNQQSNQNQQQQQQQQQQQKQGEPTLGEIPGMLSDVLAGSIKSQQDQFADLHNRIQIINHRVNEIYDMLARIEQDGKDRHNDIMHHVTPVDDRTWAMVHNIEKIERTSMRIQQDLENKDFKNMVDAINTAIQDSHTALSSHMPLAMAHIVGKEKPSMTSFLFIAVAVQIMVVGAYLVYKKRRNGAPKKYL